MGYCCHLSYYYINYIVKNISYNLFKLKFTNFSNNWEKLNKCTLYSYENIPTLTTSQNNRQPLSKWTIQPLSKWPIPVLQEWAIQSLSKWPIPPISKWPIPVLQEWAIQSLSKWQIPPLQEWAIQPLSRAFSMFWSSRLFPKSRWRNAPTFLLKIFHELLYKVPWYSC